jgi:hypothetical protein
MKKIGILMENDEQSSVRDKAEEWLQKNALMYRGDNASSCMISAFCAGFEFALHIQESGQE